MQLRFGVKLILHCLSLIYAVESRVGTKTLLIFSENENFYERCHSFAKFRQFFAKTFSKKFLRKPQSDEKWFKISV
jgi:hypothetical protein